MHRWFSRTGALYSITWSARVRTDTGWKVRRATHLNLTLEDFDWLRRIRAATDAKRDPPPVPMEIAGELRTFGFVTPNGVGRLAITDRGREALLEQDMRDAEDR